MKASFQKFSYSFLSEGIRLPGWDPDAQIYPLFKSMEVQDERNSHLSFVPTKSPCFQLTNSG